ncbi:MAG: N-acetyltransferase [Pirellulaceae bacterium]|nr:N-acetyltransferase [Pirellulaceae bacterium]
MAVTIQSVASKKEKKQFLHLPWQIYRQDANWIPPLRQNQKELAGFAPHPFYKQAESQTFLAYQDGQPVGRISAIINHAHNQRHQEKRGFFGFFETIDDEKVACSLFEAAQNWLREKGMTTLRGPLNPSLNYECGLLVDGFDTAPLFMMTYNRPYYEKLILRAGFEKEIDLYAFWGHVDMIEKLDQKLFFIIEEAKKRFDIQLRRLDRKRFNKDVRLFLDIYNQSLVSTWGFVPMSEEEIDHTSHSLKHLIAPEMTSIAEIDGRPVGAMFGLLDYNPRIKNIDGRLFPTGFLKLLWNKKRIKKVRLISTNVIPEYQKWGVGLVLLSRLGPEIINWGIEEVEFSWVLENNTLSRKTLERGGAKQTKTYRVFHKDL